MHWEKNHSRREGFTIFHHHHKVFKRSQLNTTQADPFRRQRKNHAPEFVSGIAKGHADHRPRNERIAGGRACASVVIVPLRVSMHATIVAAAARTLQLAKAVHPAYE